MASDLDQEDHHNPEVFQGNDRQKEVRKGNNSDKGGWQVVQDQGGSSQDLEGRQRVHRQRETQEDASCSYIHLEVLEDEDIECPLLENALGSSSDIEGSEEVFEGA